MSHISTVTTQIKDLEAMAEACQFLGLELDQNAKRFRYYAGKYNACDAAIRIPGNTEAYEVGLVRGKDGTYQILYDPFCGGRGMQERISSMQDASGKYLAGSDCNRLKQEYSTAVAKRRLTREGYRVQETREGGKVRLTATRRAGR